LTAASPRSPRFFLPALASLAFVSLGLPDGLLGTAWPSIRASFDQPLDAQGALLVAFTVGYVSASFSAGTLLARLSLGPLLAGSGLATALALLGYAASPVWWGLVTLAVLLGAGGGAIDAGINTWASTTHGPRMLNWLHACWGVGAALGPALVVLALETGRSWRVSYAVVGLAQIALALGFALTGRAWATRTAPDSTGAAGTAPNASGGAGTAPDAAGAAEAAPPARETLRLPGARRGALAYFLYTGVEVGFGVWAFTLFTEGRGLAPAAAGFWLSVYWGSLTVSRLLASVAAGRVSPVALVRTCLAAAAVGSGLVWLDGAPAVGFAGLTLVGLACGPVFPSMMASTPGRVPPGHAPHTVGFQVAAAAVGAAVLPALLGVVARRLGLEALGPQLLGLSVATLIAHEALARVPSSGGARA
jgi:fucose permease